MSPELVFMMGRFEARFPTDRHYARNHMWAEPQGDSFRFGFSAYAVRLLQEVYFLEWKVAPPARVRRKQGIGFIESSKAESDLCCPMTGVLTELNERLMSDPSVINADPYGEGWLFAIEGSGEELFTPDEYLQHVASTWETTQQAIKGELSR